MTDFNLPTLGPLTPKAAPFRQRSLKTVQAICWLALSDSDKVDCETLEVIFYNAFRLRREEGSKLNLVEVFASSLYSDNSKKYFASKYIDNELVLQVGSEFLTEEIILGYIKNPAGWLPSNSYLKAIMASPHVSEQVIEAMLLVIGSIGRNGLLALIPNALITPRVINAWRSTVPHEELPGRTAAAISAAVSSIKRAHPDYDGVPNEWVLKVFCGE